MKSFISKVRLHIARDRMLVVAILILSGVLVAGVVSAATTISTDINTGGQLSVTGTSTLSGGLSVTGTSSLNGNVEIGTTTLSGGKLNIDGGLNISYNGSVVNPIVFTNIEAGGGQWVLGDDTSWPAGVFAIMSGLRGTVAFAIDANDVVHIGSSGGFVSVAGGTVGIGTSSPTSQLQVTTKSSNATSTVTIGKAGQNKGTCHEEYRVDGSVIYWWWTVAGAMATSSASCK